MLSYVDTSLLENNLDVGNFDPTCVVPMLFNNIVIHTVF